LFVIIGYLVVLGSVFGGFALAGGHLAALFQPIELLMIGGAALGAFIVGNEKKAMIATVKAVPALLKTPKHGREHFVEVLGLLFQILSKIRKDGMLAIESDIESPDGSPIFQAFPGVLSQPHLVEFITDYLRLMASGNMSAFEIEGLMDEEIQAYKIEALEPSHCLAKLGDGMPAFGIVAAVMGVVHTMGSIGVPPAELGELIAHALVGTFLGILLSYGFVSPLASLVEQRATEQIKVLECLKVTILASLNGFAPTIAVEFGRKVIFSHDRPSFVEMEEHIRQLKHK
jgi:chemotaxis protein MotA